MLLTDMHIRSACFLFIKCLYMVNNMLSVHNYANAQESLSVSAASCVSFALLLLGNADLSPEETVYLPVDGPSVTHVPIATAGPG